MAESNIDFLRFSAYSMKELITRKLSEDSRFTDQVYEGSNLAILIDIVSYMYQCLAYQLNSAAAESMFADTQLYDNMVRLVKFIGYNPRGCKPASFTGYIKYDPALDPASDTFDVRTVRIPKFTYFQTQKQGQNGPVCFSVDDKYQLALESDSAQNGISVTFYNGKWKAYGTVFTSSGAENETFTLDGVRSDSAAGKFIAGDFVRVVVATPYSADGSSSGGYDCSDNWFCDTDGVFTMSRRYAESKDERQSCATNFYGPYDCVYTVVLDETKTYQVKFGDGVTGKKLRRGDRVYVFYLDTDGPKGEVDLTDVDFSGVRLLHPEDEMRKYVPDYVIEKMFGSDARAIAQHSSGFRITPSLAVASGYKAEESVGDIKQNAPSWFKVGGRLITARDTEFYIKTSGFLDNVVDVKCMNNMQYVASLYRWLYENGIKSKDEPARAAERGTGVDPGRYYLDNVTFNRANFKYVDPADANNTYLWIKTTTEKGDENMLGRQDRVNEYLYHLKTITTEYQLVKPVLVRFAVCANPNIDDIKARYFGGANVYFDEELESTIEITLDDNMIYVSSNIQKLVYDEILKAFDVNKMKLGGSVGFQDITNSIYAINGVQRVRTVYVGPDGYRNAYDGVSFASWSDESVLHFHEDLCVGNVMRHVEDFQFPVLEGEYKLFDRIKVITKAMHHQVRAIKY